jgi:hypothetical protein
VTNPEDTGLSGDASMRQGNPATADTNTSQALSPIEQETVVERLRARPSHVHRMVVDTALMDEAASRIEQLETEITAIKDVDREVMDNYRALLEAAEAENAGLREAPFVVEALYEGARDRANQNEFLLALMAACAEAATFERDEALDRVDELEKDAEIVSAEFEKDCWQAVRWLLEKVGVDDFSEGVTAQAACEIIYDEIRKGQTAEALSTSYRKALEALQQAARDLLAGMSSTYTARNGRQMGIEGDDGEKVWLVHSDLITGLEAALRQALSPEQAGQGSES